MTLAPDQALAVAAVFLYEENLKQLVTAVCEDEFAVHPEVRRFLAELAARGVVLKATRVRPGDHA